MSREACQNAYMFIRKAKTRRKTGEGSYTTYRLVRSERVGGRVRQVALLNLGADFSLPKQQWRNLTKVVEALLAGSGLLLEPRTSCRRRTDRRTTPCPQPRRFGNGCDCDG